LRGPVESDARLTRDSMATVFVIDSNKAGLEHLSFNVAMLQAVSAAARERGYRLVVFCERTQREAALSLSAAAGDYVWQDIPVVTGFRRSFVKKFTVELAVVCKLLLRARREGADVVILSLFPNVLASLLLFKPLFRKVRLHVVLHGELESLVIEEKRPIYREGFWVKLALLRLFDGSWPKLYVLGEGIKSRLLRRFPQARHLAKLRVIEHPYLFSETAPPRIPATGKLRVGFVGSGRIVKGIAEFFRLAESLSDQITAGAVEFVVVGGIERNFTRANGGWVRVLADEPAGLDVAGFCSGIASLDCAVFLFRADYLFTASGTVFDVLNEGVAVLSLQNHYLRDLAQDDSEGGIAFFEDLRGIETEIRRRLSNGVRFPRRAYPGIKRNHSVGVQATVAAEIFPS
jgi:hypothetical protein